jgi:hypothetical protein
MADSERAYDGHDIRLAKEPLGICASRDAVKPSMAAARKTPPAFHAPLSECLSGPTYKEAPWVPAPSKCKEGGR